MLTNHDEPKTLQRVQSKKRSKAATARRAPLRSAHRAAAKAGCDASLIKLCREFAALEQRTMIATLSIDSATARDRITDPLYRRQDVLLEALRVMPPPQTLAGCKAVVSTFTLLTRFIETSGIVWDVLGMLQGGLDKLQD